MPRPDPLRVVGLLRRVQPHRAGGAVGGGAADPGAARRQEGKEEVARLHGRRDHRHEPRIWHLPDYG